MPNTRCDLFNHDKWTYVCTYKRANKAKYPYTIRVTRERHRHREIGSDGHEQLGARRSDRRAATHPQDCGLAAGDVQEPGAHLRQSVVVGFCGPLGAGAANACGPSAARARSMSGARKASSVGSRAVPSGAPALPQCRRSVRHWPIPRGTPRDRRTTSNTLCSAAWSRFPPRSRALRAASPRAGSCAPADRDHREVQ
jgi:hypothetical protein